MTSHNGTFVNGRRIDRQVLHMGDTITIGITVLRIEQTSSQTNSFQSVFSDQQVIEAQTPVPESPFFLEASPKLVDCTKEMQKLLNSHADTIVKESLKIIFKILPVSRLSIFNIKENGTLTQGYTVMRKSSDKVAHMSQSFAARVLKEGKAIIIADTDALSSDGLNTSTGFQDVHSIIGVPIVIQGQNRAVLIGDNIERPHIFNQEHIRIMKFASKAIEILYQRDAIYKLDNIGNFLPICASCKKIRDDKGYWNQLESFITERAAVKFSHGYCPECADKFLAEFEASNNK